MTNVTRAVREIRSFQAMFKGLTELLEELDEAAKLEGKLRQLQSEIGALERQRTEIERGKAETTKIASDEVSKLRAEVEAAKKMVSDAKHQAAVIKADAGNQARAVEAKADEAREAIKREIAAAAAERAGIIAAAREEAAGIAKSAKLRAAESDEEIKKAQAYLEVVRSDTAAAERQLAAVKAEITRLKQAFAS